MTCPAILGAGGSRAQCQLPAEPKHKTHVTEWVTWVFLPGDDPTEQEPAESRPQPSD